MSKFLDDLHFYCVEGTHPPRDGAYQAAMDALRTMDDQIEEVMGRDFLRRYEDAVYQAQELEALESFRAGLHFGACFALEVWGQSSSTAEPRRFQASFTSLQE